MNINKILFYYPSRNTGGAEYLFKRCAEYLAETQSEYEILYADFPDGFVRQNICKANIRFVEIGAHEEVYVEDGTAVIVQLNIIYQLNRIIYNKDRSLCLFWNLHQLNIKAYIYTKKIFWISSKSRKRLGECINRLASMDVIKFMNYHQCSYIFADLLLKPCVYDWIPNIAPNMCYKKLENFNRISDKVWKFCWLGRLDEEKSRNIQTYMNELELLNKSTPLSLSLIGKGPSEKYLKQIATGYSYPITFVGEKRETELDRFIREEVEIGLASGTSAFEFAMRGKPVIMEWVIDRVYQAGERTTYTYTHEDEVYDYSVSSRVARINEGLFAEKAMTIFNDYSGVAQKDYNFVQSKTPKKCCEKLIKSILQISVHKPETIVSEILEINKLLAKAQRRINIVYRLVHPFI